MANNNLPESLCNRTNEYLASQWRYSNGLVSEDYLMETPSYIFEEQRGAKYAYLYEKCQLFKVNVNKTKRFFNCFDIF